MNKQIIIAMSGRKNAGKNTIAKYIKQHFVNYYGQESDFLECSFADSLKEFCIDALGLTHEQCYGTDEQKDSYTKYKWDNFPMFLRWKFSEDPFAKFTNEQNMTQDDLMMYFYKIKDIRNVENYFRMGFVTAREIMQIVGTDLVRSVFGNIWAQATMRKIRRSGKLLSVITDNRFPNEVDTILDCQDEIEGYIIRLTRSPKGFKDCHTSESALDRFDWNRDRCFLLNNAKMNIEEQDRAAVPIIDNIFRRFGVPPKQPLDKLYSVTPIVEMS